MAASLLELGRTCDRHAPGHVLGDLCGGSVPLSSLSQPPTFDLHQIEHETLSEQLAHRQRGDRQMQLFRNISRKSMIVFTVLPAGLAKVPNDEWTEISARALGLPSPACAHLVGRSLPQVSGRNTTHVDPYGDTLAAATNFQGGHFDKLQHDPVGRAVARFATVCGYIQAQAENSKMFGSVLRQKPGSMRTEEVLLRVRAATVDVYVEHDQPDGQAAVGHIVEMKTVHYGLTHYNAVAPTRGHAVENRSGKLDAERRRQLQQTDREVFRTREGQVGPMEQRLNGFPP
ncbi:hypothetical protein T492DRAFT_866421, partial [Pavlovales sp. CCMP2436]